MKRLPGRDRKPGRLSVGFLAASLAFLAACSGEKAVQSAAPVRKEAVPVTAGNVVQKAIPVELHVIGNVQAYSTVSVKAQVGGELTRVYFKEGQDVKQGELLFTIDARPFEAALKQAEANLARDIAQAKNAEAEARRYQELYRSGIVAVQQYDQMRTTAEALQSVAQADQAAIENAKLQLGYTTIRSPLEGRTGNLLVHEGNLVKANDVALVVINQVRPIYVSFAVPGQNLPEIKRRMGAGKLKVEASVEQGGRPVVGELTFVDNAIDVTTGTIQLKGTFSNEEKSFWPGQFVQANLTLTTQKDAVVVPSQAVQAGQQGQYVFVVKPDLTVEARPVVVSRTYGQDVVIEKGLRPGEKVVTDGQLRLVPGATVRLLEGRGAGEASR